MPTGAIVIAVAFGILAIWSLIVLVTDGRLGIPKRPVPGLEPTGKSINRKAALAYLACCLAAACISLLIGRAVGR